MMKAIRVHSTGGPEVLDLEELPDPVPGPADLLVKVEAIGLNFIEIYFRQGLYPSPLPFIPGSEVAGVVVGVGAEVKGFRVGDRIVTQNARGAYATMTVVPADKAVKIPEAQATKVAAAAWLQGLTAHYLTHSTFPLKPGHSCIVHAAAGGVGLLLCQMAKAKGAFVIGTASTPAKRELAKHAGADEVIDYTTTDFSVEARRLTGGAGVDVVYDSVGASTFQRSLQSIKPRGMLVLFGASSGPVPPFDPQLLNRNGSLFLTRPTLAHYVATRAELEQRGGDLLGWIASGALDVRIGAEFALADAAKAHVALASRGTTGKTLIIP
jgi:NADPH2:quinone reductase